MTLTDGIIIAVVVLILGLAGFYVYRAKKSGKKCVGCPDGCSCSSKKGQGCCGAKKQFFLCID